MQETLKLPPSQRAALELLREKGRINWSSTTVVQARALNALVAKGLVVKQDSVYLPAK